MCLIEGGLIPFLRFLEVKIQFSAAFLCSKMGKTDSRNTYLPNYSMMYYTMYAVLVVSQYIHAFL